MEVEEDHIRTIKKKKQQKKIGRFYDSAVESSCVEFMMCPVCRYFSSADTESRRSMGYKNHCLFKDHTITDKRTGQIIYHLILL